MAVGVRPWQQDSGGNEAVPAGPSVEVVQMNVCGGLGCYGEDVPDRMQIVDYAVDVLAGTRADFALLNEICMDQLDAIVAQLDASWAMSAVSVDTLATGNGCAGHAYGNAVLHRGTLVEARTFESCQQGHEPCLENPPLELSGEQRAMVCATARPPGIGNEVTACSVHLVPRGSQPLDGRSWDEWNDLQLQSLRTLVVGALDDMGPVVVGGDFNVVPERVLDAWPPGWSELDDELRPTRPVRDPRRKIDYVMLSPGLHAADVELLDVATCPASRLAGRWCTDHRPLAGTVIVG